MISQIQLVAVADVERARTRILGAKNEILSLADRAVPGLCQRGGGARDIEVRTLGTTADAMIVVHVIVDVRDAMGANLVNTVAEAIAERLAELAHGRVGLRILSNLCDKRCVRVRCRVPKHVLATEHMDGDAVIDGIVNASRFAELDPYRAATHNKGIMNGIDAVVIATGNDWRAVEAGAHASRRGLDGTNHSRSGAATAMPSSASFRFRSRSAPSAERYVCIRALDSRST
jgi:hydroxymethylglutaryl-CoA reductase